MLQQMPCSPTGGGETFLITVHAAKEGGLRDSEKDYLLKLNQDGKSREIERHEQIITDYRAEMSRQMAALHDRKQFANNNLAGATWEQSLSGEMSAVAQKYDSLIRSEQIQIDQLRKDILAVRE
jgi:hypothetical protein